MKRFLAVLLVLMFGIMSVAVAEETSQILDLSGYSVDELLQIEREVDEALAQAGGKVMLPSGQLVAGVDIAAGSYIIEPHNISDTDYSYCFTILIWKSKDAKDQYDKDYNDYRAAYRKAEEDKEAGKDYEYPAEPVESDYVVYRERFDHTNRPKITLEDGNVLTWETNWGVKLDLTIEKAKGLFMD